MVDDAQLGGGPHPLIAAAVIVSGGRVLLVRRSVPETGLVWQFPAGKVEADESDLAAAARETREEVGLQVTPTHRLGTRTHPKTGRQISYIACRVDSGDAGVAAPAEVAEIAWCDRLRLAALVPAPLHEPVRLYLDSMLDPASPLRS